MARTIPLSNGHLAIVDDDLHAVLSQRKWSAGRVGNIWYAIRYMKLGKRKYTRIRMHREVLEMRGVALGETIDHINGNGLDNRSENLRVATRQQNQCNRGRQSNNRSGYKGVFFDSQSGRWRAKIWNKGKQLYAGAFSRPEDAARAYDTLASTLHGEFARLNFPREAAQ